VKQFRFKRKFNFNRYRKPNMGRGSRLIQYFISLVAAAGEVVWSWEHGDLAAAVRNLDKTLKEIGGKIDVKRCQKVVLLMIEHRQGRNVYACESRNTAIDQLYSFVEEHWNEMPEEVGPIPADRREAIEIYFEEKQGRESYEILTLPVHPAIRL
jgi:hypothetical protein